MSVFGNISMSSYTGTTMGNVNASVNVDAEKVKSLRTALNLSQQDLAAMSGLSKRTIIRVERGAGVSLETIKSIAAALDIPSYESLIKHPDRVTADAPSLFTSETQRLARAQKLIAMTSFDKGVTMLAGLSFLTAGLIVIFSLLLNFYDSSLSQAGIIIMNSIYIPALFIGYRLIQQSRASALTQTSVTLCSLGVNTALLCLICAIVLTGFSLAVMHNNPFSLPYGNIIATLGLASGLFAMMAWTMLRGAEFANFFGDPEDIESALKLTSAN
jgi:transcriptional regulator with XRE-family HTH domain